MRRREFLKAATCAPAVLGPGERVQPEAVAPPATRATQAGGPWQPDGWAWNGRLAVLMPHSEWIALAPEGVSVQAMRVRWVGVKGPNGAVTRTGGDAARAFVESPLMD